MQIIIKKLFGKKNYNVNFNKHVNVLIGENGCGKSTLLKIIDYISHRDFISLSKYLFDEIIICDNENEDTIVRNDLLQLSFSSDLDFKLRFYQFTNDYLVNMNMSNELDTEEEFEKYYEQLIEHFGLDYKYLELNSSIDSEEYFKEYVYNDINFILNCDYEKEYSDRYFDQQLQSYLMAFFDSNKVVYGSKMYFKIIFIFMLLLTYARKYPKEVFEGVKPREVDFFNSIFGTPYVNNLSVSGWHLKKDNNSEYTSFYVFCENSSKILDNTKYYDYVVFKEETKNTYEQIKNIRFFEKDTLYHVIDKILDILKENKNYSDKQKKNSNYLSFEDIKKVCDLNTIEPTIRLIDYELKKLKGFSSYNYWSNEEFEVLKNALDFIFDKDEWNEAFDTKGLNFIGLFEFLQSNYDKILQSINSKELVMFKQLTSKYMSNKIIDFSVDNLLLNKNPLLIYDKSTNKEIDYSFLSSGEKKIIRLMLMMCFDKKDYKILLLDEPELSLSPYWQEMLLNDLDEYCKTTLIIIATQSPNLINEDQLDWLIEVKKEG